MKFYRRKCNNRYQAKDKDEKSKFKLHNLSGLNRV